MDKGVLEACGIGYACGGIDFGKDEGERGNDVATRDEGEGHGGGVGEFEKGVAVVRGFKGIFHEVVEPFGHEELGLLFVDFACAAVLDMEGGAKCCGFAEFYLGDEVAVVLEVVVKVLKGIETRGVDISGHFEGLAPLADFGTGAVFEFAHYFSHD